MNAKSLPSITPPEYKKSFEDELDWKMYDQLHHAVLQISSFCFETKKFCVATEFVALPLIAKFTRDKLDHSLFVTGVIILFSFWILDAIGYFYQAKLRQIMRAIENRMASRNYRSVPKPDFGREWDPPEQLLVLRSYIKRVSELVIGAKPTHDIANKKFFEALFNHSMWLYVILFIVDFIAWLFFVCGIIR